MKKTLLIAFSLTSIFSFGQGQIGNSDMESWEAVAGSEEPNNWNSFLTASGGFATFASNQIEQSPDVRPGSAGSKSCKIWSKSTFGVIANGNVTLGQINMGSTTPSNASNHNKSITSNSLHSETLTDSPDSIVFWTKFTPVSGSGNARMKATLHDSFDYQDPEDAASATHVVATAIMNYPNTNGSWVRFAVPFDYSGPVSVNTHILVTFTTNETPGGGSGNDEVLIDDVELIYNPIDVDSDGDGVSDAAENADGTDLNDLCDFVLASQNLAPSASWNAADCDSDGFTNENEITNGTDPLVFDAAAPIDTDGDGVTDTAETSDGTDLNDFCDFVLASQTIAPSALWNSSDCDLDGVTNEDEVSSGSDPLVTISELTPNAFSLYLIDENVIINSKIELTGSYIIYNTSGQKIQNGAIESIINFVQPNGVYFIVLKYEGKEEKFKVVKF